MNREHEPSGLASIIVPSNHVESTRPARKILFSSAHSVLDFSNGASVATMDVLQGLTALGFECQAFCTAKLDLQSDVSFEKMIGDLHEPYEVRESVCGEDRARILYTRRSQVPITFIRQQTTRHTKQTIQEIQTVLRFFARFLDADRPDVLFTYGGDPVTQGMIAVAKRRGIPVVFAIHRAVVGRAPRCGAAIRPGIGVSSVWGGSLSSGAGEGFGRRGAGGALRAQFAEHWFAGGILRERPSLRPQMEAQAARRHVVCGHSGGREGSCAG